MPLVRRTRATLRRAEFGFFGVVVYTRVHTPRRWGLGLADLVRAALADQLVDRRHLVSVRRHVVRPCRTRMRHGLLVVVPARPPTSGVSDRVLPPALPTPTLGRGVRWTARRE